MTEQVVYESRSVFDPSRVGAAALYCSDGRYGEQMDEFLHQGCGWPRYDRIAAPGGPAVFSGDPSVLWDESFLRRGLEYLARSHQLQHLALIGHEGCGFYHQWLHLQPDKIEQRQLRDLEHARKRISVFLPGVEIRALLARKQEGIVRFFEVP
jgi:hypothetical protein